MNHSRASRLYAQTRFSKFFSEWILLVYEDVLPKGGL